MITASPTPCLARAGLEHTGPCDCLGARENAPHWSPLPQPRRASQ